MDGIQLILILNIFQNSPTAFSITGKEPPGRLNKSV